jgi:hypothetical protein
VQPADGRRAILVGGLEDPQEPGPAVRANRLGEAAERRPVHGAGATTGKHLVHRIRVWPIASMRGVSNSEERRAWPVILGHTGIVLILYSWSGVVPPGELESDWFAISMALGMILGGVGLASALWYGLRENIRRSSSDNLSVGAAWLLTAGYFIGTFSSLYWIESVRDADAFTEALTHNDAIYFALTTFTTTGFGDIAAKSGIARLTVSAQMVVGFVLVAVALVLALSRWSASREGS